MVYAVKFGRRWYIANIVKAETYGEPHINGIPADKLVWSEDETTAFLGDFGNEDKCIELKDHCEETLGDDGRCSACGWNAKTRSYERTPPKPD